MKDITKESKNLCGGNPVFEINFNQKESFYFSDLPFGKCLVRFKKGRTYTDVIFCKNALNTNGMPNDALTCIFNQEDLEEFLEAERMHEKLRLGKFSGLVR